MTKPTGPREGDEYGYDPARERAAKVRSRIKRMEADAQDRSKEPRQLGEAAGIPKLTPTRWKDINSSASIRSESPEEISYQHAVLCQTVLPSRSTEAREWTRQQGRAFLKVIAGQAFNPELGEFVLMPLPYGPKARLVVIHLNSEAVRTGSPVIEAEDSLTAFVRRLMGGKDPNGREIRAFKDQLGALSASSVLLAVTGGAKPIQVNTYIIEKFNLWFPKDERQRVIWPSKVELSHGYFESLTKHAVPLDERAIACLARNPTALDVYCWLAHRLHRIPQGKPQFVPWTALYEQFGQGYTLIRQFRSYFRGLLKLVHSQYPAARLDMEYGGLSLWTSPPPIAKRLVQVAPMVIDHKP
jgi:Plasmid encoded RepA protein